ncbi:MAG: hypothetical protein ACRCZI_09670, partial [Cetobacterium sp.]
LFAERRHHSRMDEDEFAACFAWSAELRVDVTDGDVFMPPFAAFTADGFNLGAGVGTVHSNYDSAGLLMVAGPVRPRPHTGYEQILERPGQRERRHSAPSR